MLQIVADTPIERWRRDTLFTKEPGTVAWIQRECKPGDVFYDIGANIGQYSLMAARQVMPGGCVVAFEPHLANALSLLKNVAANKLSGVTVITSALHSDDGFLPFNYQSVVAGSSGSQLGHTTAENGQSFTPDAVELKHATTIERLISDAVIPRPSLVKIDVDGNELEILKGFGWYLLMHAEPLRSIQVEVHSNTHPGIAMFLDAYRWREVETHYTANGQKQLDRGIAPDQIISNVIYERVPHVR
jgi:FkbM family methyltransferase